MAKQPTKPDWVLKFERGVDKVTNFLNSLDFFTRVIRALGKAATTFKEELINPSKDVTTTTEEEQKS